MSGVSTNVGFDGKFSTCCKGSKVGLTVVVFWSLVILQLDARLTWRLLVMLLSDARENDWVMLDKTLRVLDLGTDI